MNTDEHRYDLVFCLFRRICGYDSVELSSLLVLISLPGESTSVFYGVGKKISMSIIQSQCSVACSTMPLHIKFPTTAALERGRLGSADLDSYSGSDSRRIPSLRRTTLKLISNPTLQSVITSPFSPRRPFIMPLGASAAVVNNHLERHTSRVEDAICNGS